MIVLGIDPGTRESGYVLYSHDGPRVVESGDGVPNEIIRERLRQNQFGATHCAIETIETFMLRVGRDVFETCIWVGVFKEAWERQGKDAYLVNRGDEKIVMCGAKTFKDPDTGKQQKVNDAMIASACRAAFPPTGGGSRPEVGIKSHPGPLYGVKGHSWQALAVVLTAIAVYGLDGNVPMTLERGSKKKLVPQSEEIGF